MGACFDQWSVSGRAAGDGLHGVVQGRVRSRHMARNINVVLDNQITDGCPNDSSASETVMEELF